jgi:hypothetical protein
MGTRCGFRERANPDDWMGAENCLLDVGGKAVREEEDGIGSGSQGTTFFFCLHGFHYVRICFFLRTKVF